MSEKRSLIAFEHYREGEQRFEYFITGVSTALCAYVGQTLQAQKFGFNPYTLEVISLGLVVGSIILSFKRIELGVWLRALNHNRLHMGEVRGALMSEFRQRPTEPILNEETGDTMTPEQIVKQIGVYGRYLRIRDNQLRRAQAKILKYYHWRNWLLLCGFVGLFVSKILVPYIR
jgi:hypothetical protein